MDPENNITRQRFPNQENRPGSRLDQPGEDVEETPHWTVIPGSGGSEADSLLIIDVLDGNVVGRISARGRLISHPIVHGDRVSFTAERGGLDEDDKQEAFGQVHKLPGGALIDTFRVSSDPGTKFEPIFQRAQDREKMLKPIIKRERELDLKIQQTEERIEQEFEELEQLKNEIQSTQQSLNKRIEHNKEQRKLSTAENLTHVSKALQQIPGSEKAVQFLNQRLGHKLVPYQQTAKGQQAAELDRSDRETIQQQKKHSALATAEKGKEYYGSDPDTIAAMKYFKRARELAADRRQKHRPGRIGAPKWDMPPKRKDDWAADDLNLALQLKADQAKDDAAGKDVPPAGDYKSDDEKSNVKKSRLSLPRSLPQAAADHIEQPGDPRLRGR